MSIIVLDTGIKNDLDTLTNQAGVVTLPSMVARLYTNNHTPIHTDVIGAFTEAAFTGYAGQALPTWAAAVVAASVASSLAGAVTFNNGSAGSVNVYGYYVTNAGNTVAYWAEIFAGAPLAIPAGLGLQLTITFTVQSLN
jgi:hypothetical protein